MRNETALQNATCPHCGYKFDACTSAHTNNPEHTPHAGSVSLCITCGEFAMFTEELTLRKFTDEEETEILTDPGVKRVRQAWAMMDAERQQKGAKIH